MAQETTNSDRTPEIIDLTPETSRTNHIPNCLPAPLFIGGIGGSGTRIFVRIAQHAGLFMGTKMNKALDSRTFAKALGRWSQISLRSDFPLPWYLRFARDIDFSLAQTRHCAALPSAQHPWGVKNPRTILILPYLNQKYLEMKFLHVVRDGRDMAFSTNQNQLQKYGELIFESDKLTNASQPVRSIIFWSLVNLRASNFAEVYMQDRYLRVNFEDLCGDPAVTVRRVFDFLGHSEEGLQAAVAEVQSPPTIGRWRNFDTEIVAQVTEAGREALEKFGYIAS